MFPELLTKLESESTRESSTTRTTHATHSTHIEGKPATPSAIEECLKDDVRVYVSTCNRE